MTVKTAAGVTVAGSEAYDTGTAKATFTPTAALAASTTVHGGRQRRQGRGRQRDDGDLVVVHHRGRHHPADHSAATTPPPTTPPPTTPPTGAVSIWAATAVPGTPADSDNAAVELGLEVPVRCGRPGHRGALLQGHRELRHPHGHLWTAAGVSLGTVTFTGETASGWQTASFAPRSR